MLYGQFTFKNGLVVPNNITTFGIQTILNMAFLNTDSSLWVGLCNAVFQPDLQIESLEEPTIGVNGYARQEIPRSVLGWPATGMTNLQPFVESDDLIWTPVGGNYDAPISRMFICLSDVAVTGDVFAISGALSEEITFTPAMLEVDRTLKYRIYAR